MGKLWSFDILSNLHKCDIWCHFCSLCSSNELSQTIYIPICCIAASASIELMRPNGSRINSVKLWKTLKMNFPRDCCWIIRFISINCMNYMLWGFCGQKIAHFMMSKCLVITAILKVIWNSQHMWPIYVEKTIENLIWRCEMHLVVLKGWFACIYQHWIYI